MLIKTVLLVLYLFVTVTSYASHCAGDNITYKYTGVANTYLVESDFYRDCFGINAGGSVIINISSVIHSYSFNTVALLVSVTKVANYCSSINTTCDTTGYSQTGTPLYGSYPGIQKYVYTVTVVLPYTSSDWIFSYGNCCRNALITNLTSPTSQTMLVYSQLNNSNGDNSSPTFSENLAPFVCTGDDYCYDNGASDADGDSIVYTLVIAQQQGYIDVVYNTGYTYLKPIPSSPALTFSNTTGLLCFTCSTQGVYVFAVEVRCYDNGVLVNVVERDIQVVVTACPCTPLPIMLISFEGEALKDHNLLTWQTASEQNNNYFTIEKNGYDIAQIEGSGTTDVPHSYSYEDSTAVITYYRLKQTDYDGKVSYSRVIAVANKIKILSWLHEFNLLGQELVNRNK